MSEKNLESTLEQCEKFYLVYFYYKLERCEKVWIEFSRQKNWIWMYRDFSKIFKKD